MALLDLDAIKLANPLPQVASSVGLKLKSVRGELVGCCPFHEERSPSFTIFDGGRKFHCFGCGASGDVLDFLSKLRGVGLREAARILTGGSLPSIHVQPIPVKEKADRLDEARAIWRAAQPVHGTLAETYLRSRGIHLRIPDSIRFSRLRYGKHGPEHPCVVAAIASADNRLIGIQRTYLAESGRSKADVPKAKLSLGRVSGGAIRLAPAARSMMVCEGLEDGLTLMQELGRAVWVAAGAGNMPNMHFPAGVQSVAIGGDNDDTGRREARKAADAYPERGIQARTFFPIEGKDFNAELMEGAAV
jgi:DNA primase